ncbi:DNA polymerase III subunit tau [Paraurantiacibacter namhicola]|uniref:DNA polymerase III subunit tau n=2 Tax=Paraurantiacibacter namhicola TaxID=645517 RepID=A0A1C7D951_9SPHN|nr:DNA polymerase III subunit tau [Paraurantiacibacter namhicola]
MAGERMHHGWILAGRKGSGKMQFALEAAHRLVGGDMDPLSHPDIHVLSHLPATRDDEKKRDEGKPFNLKRNIAVDQIRAMQQRLNTRPTLGDRRAIIIDPADDLEKSASNAVLKSLEEPPQGSFFLLVTHRPGRLLPTIRSRCRIVRFPQLSQEQVEAILAEHAPEADPAARQAAAAASGGSPGAALEFMELDLARLHKAMSRIAHEGDDDFALRGELTMAMGARPDRRRQLAAIDLARAVVAGEMARAQPRSIPALVQAHSSLSQLAAQAPTYNFDPGLLVMEIGGLLASLAASRDTANA